ncbi:hypothetical protein ZYGR_0K00570 [Zygosaccharomyces rouxii]|uniref:SH3 domain-containing protein n=1 Tax=Zygosaccharomyces rouxii TaxID=4956 RepID=A0A1Q2ZYN0_ZYGRO|nr:hypothetical protein ZYGR_0K00570 [Zygosaccharomyces rouxii]
MSATTTLEPVSNYDGTDGYTPLVPSMTQSDPPLSRMVSTKGSPSPSSSPSSSSSAVSSTDRGLQGVVDSQKFTSGPTIGLAIGLPVGVFCLGLALFLGLSKMRQKLTINRRKSVQSTTLPTATSDQGWFSRVMYGTDSQYGQEYAYEKSLPFADSSTIQYKVSKSRPQHILTPKAPKLRDEFTSLEGMSIKDDVDALLYSKPPNIYHIQSEMPSTNNLPGEKLGLSVSSPSKRPKPANLELPLHKWRYESPLSSWFLRNSTYLAGDEADAAPDGGANAGTILTPTVQLKQLKILSRINKGYADGSQLMENEKSPILEKPAHNSEDETESRTNDMASSIGTQLVKRPSSAFYGTITSGTKNRNPFKHPNENKMEERKTRRESILGFPLQEVTDKKPLPLTPGKDVRSDYSSERLQMGHVYKVVQDYKAMLADEIDIQVGEFALILATHTDGWCLVEKCTEDGTSKSYLKTGQTVTNANDRGYLNSDRGIIPGDCLDDL